MVSNTSVEPFKTPLFIQDTVSEEETFGLAARLARHLAPGDWIALVGDLAAGKTAFVRGLAQALGCREPATSPTFVLCQTYRARAGRKEFPLNHVDLYRLNVKELAQLDWDGWLASEGVTVVEWAEKASHLWPDACLVARISHLGEDSRRFEFFARGARPAQLAKHLKEKK